ncbi:MAG: YajQ family cyclic di-GMP-binding protein [Candidatus Gracilibacteria bacterium]
MAKEHSMDISVQFSLQELINSVDQTKKEAFNRYDLKDAGIEIELGDDFIKVTAQGEMQIEAVYGILVKKMVGRGVSPRILDRQKIEEIGGMRVRQEMKLIKALDQETAKKISALIKAAFPKAKPIIQGEVVRVNSASIDELQAIIAVLKANESVKVPLQFGNYR